MGTNRQTHRHTVYVAKLEASPRAVSLLEIRRLSYLQTHCADDADSRIY